MSNKQPLARATKNILRLLGHQHYIRFGIRDRILRGLHEPDTAGSEEFSVPFFGFVYKGNFNTFIDWSVFYYGAYAREELNLMSDLLASIKEPIVFDIGANIGHHTLYLAKCSKKVFAFEPFEAVSKKIFEKINDNKIVNVDVCNFGLGVNHSIEKYYPPEGANSGTGSFIAGNAKAEHISLEIMRGDDFVKGKDIRKVDLIKMDIEGFEPFALAGLTQTLETFRPIVFFEWSQNDRKSFEKDEAVTLFPHDYVFYNFISDTVKLKFFRKMRYRLKPTHEPWKDGNLLAVPKERLEQLRKNNDCSYVAHQLLDMEST